MNLVVCIAIFFLAGTGLLFAWRQSDRNHAKKIWQGLLSQANTAQGVFDPHGIKALPEAAQRYFCYCIRPGARLYSAVELVTEGELGLGTRSRHSYRPMSARQLLAPPFGLVWNLEAGALCGSDGVTPDESWTRFWLYGIFPVVRSGGSADHRRSAFGRVVAEAAFWAPASLLPSDTVRWEEVDNNTARAIVSFGGFQQVVDISVARDGQPTRVVIPRWSNENAEKIFREQPFGGDLSEFEDFEGYRLPRRVEGGNHIGTADYFPFYKARIMSIRFPPGVKTS
jgi:hypothetical protein